MNIVTSLFVPEMLPTAVSSLTKNGFDQKDLSTVANAANLPSYLEGEATEAAGNGMLVGAATGGVIGAVGSLAASAIPGMEATAVSGLMATAAGGVIGGYLGSLYTVRAEEQTEMDLHEALAGGDVLLVVKTTTADRSDQALQLLEQAGGRHTEIHNLSDSDALGS